jgi:DNA-binding CsgD family transcriptional regulator
MSSAKRHIERRQTLFDEHTIMAHLNLTLAEARVAALLANDHTTREIAKRLQIQENTVRAHLKSAYAKTRTRNRGELIRLLFIFCTKGLR